MPDDLPAEDVATFPRPPSLTAEGRHVTIRWRGHLIVDTARASGVPVQVVRETFHPPAYYVPPAAVDFGIVRAAAGGRGSFCEWKGRAVYFDLLDGTDTVRGVAWAYPDPTPRFAALQDHLAFYAGRVDACQVEGVAVMPQPGDFYGGWVTPNLTGPIKGGPGTAGW